VRSVVPPTYRKFQPAPRRRSADAKDPKPVPATLRTTWPDMRAAPVSMIATTPNRVINDPVKNDGRNIPST